MYFYCICRVFFLIQKHQRVCISPVWPCCICRRHLLLFTYGSGYLPGAEFKMPVINENTNVSVILLTNAFKRAN